MAKGSNVKTQVGDLNYVFITGEGRNQSKKGAEPKYQFVASIITKEGSPLHKDMEKQIEAEWTRYKEENKVKGRPKTNGIKIEKKPDPKGEIDPETEEVRRIPTGNVVITFKTNTKWPDGNPQVVKVYANQKDATGKVYAADVTEQVHAANWTIGNGSTGIIHGRAMGNDVGGDHKVTLYLSAIQIATLKKYEGTEIEAAEIEDAEVVDLGVDMEAPLPTPDASETPNLD